MVLAVLRVLAGGVWVLGCGLLLVADARESAGLAELAELRASMVGGGGVVFVRNAEDCGATAGPVEVAAAALLERGVVVQGVILKRGPVEAAVQRASAAFPHRTLSIEATTALTALGHVHTPLAMVVDPSGTIVKVEALAGRSASAILESLAAT